MMEKNQIIFFKDMSSRSNTWVFAVAVEGVMNVESLYLQK